MKKITLLRSTDTTHVIQIPSGPIELPRVTSIIKSGGLSDFSHVDHDTLERAQNFGKAVHRICEYNDTGKIEDIDPNLIAYLVGWQKFRRKEKWASKKPDLIEQVAYSIIWGIAGIPDRVWGDNLVDIKTPDTINKNQIKEAEAQTASYAKMLKESRNITIRNRFIVHLIPNDYKLIPLTRTESWTAFTHCLGVYRWKIS